MHHYRTASLHRAALAAALATGVLLLAGCSGEETLPSCPTSRTGSVDVVPSGPRPCVLYGTAGVGDVRHGQVQRPRDGSGRKATTASKAPAAPKVPLTKH